MASACIVNMIMESFLEFLFSQKIICLFIIYTNDSHMSCISLHIMLYKVLTKACFQ